ncbi:hypothetical protein [Peribacillus frigoritolerans]|uniref:hypothetical protein n=1 Tax=Peribacillus frigoritolerans TaxID=450367 RepID=UPI0007BFC685
MSKSTEEEMVSIQAELMERLKLKRQLGNYEEKKRKESWRNDMTSSKTRGERNGEQKKQTPKGTERTHCSD